ncbi:sigma-70 family RNA polymerase sigma factor [Luteolibacter pohnpeiensis]|uniref:Sigma-70 family RNA polymerase sigma factor n=2 Tax=Luteolibacter pohnpeiensis TaxID=454153 RepID=A0A934VUH6_9BACT|nr:sigma-70 family RNA polymerase sigma factor [Luteolibacter pohnpeiensis]
MPLNSDPNAKKRLFLTTRWSVVADARQPASQDGADALASLCETYWYPLYVYVRSKGHSIHDAQDLTQAFFAKLLEKGYLHSAQREKGKFRTFLLMALNRFLWNEWDRGNAKKRGGNMTHFSLDADVAEHRFAREATAGLAPDEIYQRRWALTLLDQAMARLRTAYSNSGKEREFDALKTTLTADRAGVSYQNIAQALDMTEGAARVAAHRLRKRFREMFREEIASTVANDQEIEEEIRYVVSVLSRG